MYFLQQVNITVLTAKIQIDSIQCLLCPLFI